MTLPALDTHTTAVVAALTAAHLHAGDGVRPDGAGWQGNQAGVGEFRSYCIVYPLPVILDGTLARPSDDVDGVWQITSVAPTRHGAQFVADRARTALLDTGIAVTGRGVFQILFDGGGGVNRDDTDNPALFYAVERFRITTTPT